MLRGAEFPSLENRRVSKFPFHVFLIDMKFIFEMFPDFTDCFEVSWYNKIQKYWVPRLENQEIMKMSSFDI